MPEGCDGRAAFLEDTVTPRFPDDLTVLDAQGQWDGSERGNTEGALQAAHKLAPTGDDKMRLTDEVSGEYERRFGQESVLRVVEDVCVSFS